MPALQAEEHLELADIIATFGTSSFSEESAKSANRQRKRYLNRKHRIYSTVKNLYDGIPVIDDSDDIKPIKKVDFSNLSDQERLDLANWAKTIGAK